MATVNIKRRDLRQGGAAAVAIGGWDDLVTILNAQVTLANILKLNINLFLVKLDADSGVAATNYAATNPIGSTVVDALGLVK